jgi:hypothetical protein
MALECMLRRARGSPVTARTRDIGPGGMCAWTSRPLTIDEGMVFDLALNVDERLRGQARVLREQDFGLYALRFERLSDVDRRRLHDVAVGRHPVVTQGPCHQSGGSGLHNQPIRV